MTRAEYHAYLHSAKWQRKRLAVIARADGTCEQCGSQPVQQIHHCSYRLLGSEPLEDLLGVCRSCHEALHGFFPDENDDQ